MSSVSPISGQSITSNIDPISKVKSSTPSNIEESYRFEDKINFTELELPQSEANSDAQTVELTGVLNQLMLAVLIDGCDIVARGALKHKDSVVEASFRPPLSNKDKPQIFAPVKGLPHKLTAVNHLLNGSLDLTKLELTQIMQYLTKASSNLEILKLIILMAHEYGHYKSFQRGLHDSKLKFGLSLVFTKSADYNSAYAVFREEVSAWDFAKATLDKYGFKYFDQLDKIKYNSLNAYFKQLDLVKAGVGIYCDISMLGLDLALLEK